MKKIIAIAAVAATLSTPAMAWGEKEQGVLAGIIGTLILQDIARGNTPTLPAPQHPNNNTVIHNHYHSQHCGTEIRTRWTDNGAREIRDTVNRCTGALIERREIFHR